MRCILHLRKRVGAASTVLATSDRWNATYLVWAVAGALVLAGFRFAFGAPERAARPQASAAGAARNPLTLALRSPLVWLTAVFLFVGGGAEVSLGSWSYTLLTEGRHLPALPASWTVSGYWLGLTVGRVALGRVADRWSGGADFDHQHVRPAGSLHPPTCRCRVLVRLRRY